jgi:hypothetical protein
MHRVSLCVAVVLALLAAAWPEAARAENVLDAKVMKIVLHTSTAQEDGFIEYVLARVERGSLPRDLVQSTFLWAKRKPTRRFFYFKEGLILRAKQRGIRL